MYRLIGLLGTLLVHAAFILALIGPSCTPKKTPPASPEAPIEVRLIPKPDPVKEKAIKQEKGPVPEPAIVAEAEPECQDKTYDGIGMIWSQLSQVVLSVGKGYPAERAGIRAGDQITTLERSANYMDITLIREGVTLSLRVPVEKICFNESTEGGAPTLLPNER